MTSKTHTSAQISCGRQLNTKVCGSESAIFLCVQMCLLFKEFGRYYSFKFTLVNNTVHSTTWLVSVAWAVIFKFCTHVHKYACSQTKDHDYWYGSKASTQAKSQVDRQ